MSLNNNDVLKVSFEFQRQDRRCFCVRHYYVDNVVGTPSAQDVGDELMLDLTFPFCNLFRPDTLFATTWVVRVPDVIPTERGQTNNSFAGTLPAGGTLPYQIASLITLRPAAPLPRRVSRVYVPFVPTGTSVSGVGLSGTYQLRLLQCSIALLNAWHVGSFPDECDVYPCLPALTGGVIVPLARRSVSELRVTQRRRGGFWHGPGFHFPP